MNTEKLNKQISQYEGLMKAFAQNGDIENYEKYERKVEECRAQLENTTPRP